MQPYSVCILREGNFARSSCRFLPPALCHIYTCSIWPFCFLPGLEILAEPPEKVAARLVAAGPRLLSRAELRDTISAANSAVPSAVELGLARSCNDVHI